MDTAKTPRQTISLRRFLACAGALAASLALLGPAHAAGSAEAGQARSIVCAGCHGVDGNSFNPEWPSLAGQNANYLVKSMQSFKDGSRQNVLMNAQAAALSEQDMQDLAAWFSSQKLASKTADPALVSSGERLFRGGNKASGVPACAACHGPAGQGNTAAGWPAIAGQHATYSGNQLIAYRSDQRTTDGDTRMMRSVAARLTDEEIKAVTAYAQGLRP
ncbi:MAG: cytochrome c4 [Gammaproteobacteria bacterium]|jgi:cbb3-type cytochrome c oxidase subunit III|nr:cytochrome c4 [Gammaproteobacteria bacterium]